VSRKKDAIPFPLLQPAAPSVPSEASPSDTYEHPNDIAYNLRQLLIQVVNWQYGWGAENLWESEFNNQLSAAREEGQDAIDHFFHNCETRAMQGRDILKDLKFMAAVSCNGTSDEIRDLFLQGYDMVIGVASEVKFFEVKLDEFAPAIPMTKLSDIRHYSGM
jgi:hypothetical protein